MNDKYCVCVLGFNEYRSYALDKSNSRKKTKSFLSFNELLRYHCDRQSVFVTQAPLTNPMHLTFVPTEKQRFSLCVGCGAQNHDQYILRVAPDLEWHAACLKCQECRQFLDESCTCFVRDGKTYCKRDYVR